MGKAQNYGTAVNRGYNSYVFTKNTRRRWLVGSKTYQFSRQQLCATFLLLNVVSLEGEK